MDTCIIGSSFKMTALTVSWHPNLLYSRDQSLDEMMRGNLKLVAMDPNVIKL